MINKHSIRIRFLPGKEGQPAFCTFPFERPDSKTMSADQIIRVLRSSQTRAARDLYIAFRGRSQEILRASPHLSAKKIRLQALLSIFPKERRRRR